MRNLKTEILIKCANCPRVVREKFIINFESQNICHVCFEHLCNFRHPYAVLRRALRKFTFQLVKLVVRTLRPVITYIRNNPLALFALQLIKYLIFFTLIAHHLWGCGKSVDVGSVDSYSVPAEVEPYVQQFRTDAISRGYRLAYTNLNVVFVDSLAQVEAGEHFAGYCYPGPVPRVEILRSWWSQMSDFYRKRLVYHELGHCWLGRDHSDSPFSMMYHLVQPNQQEWVDYIYIWKKFYIDELFGKVEAQDYSLMVGKDLKGEL